MSVRRLLPLISLLVALVLLALVLPVTAQPAGPNPGEARAMIAALNQWRISIGLSPLQPNPVLERMALDQVTYVAGLPQFPNDFHAGPRGDHPRERALFPQYSWPTFGNAQQIVLNEIAAVQPNIQRAVTWWQNSDLHNRTVSNPVYREIGVGVIPYRHGFIYIVVVGSQPNVLPAFADPRGGTLYLTNEKYTSGSGAWLRSAHEFQIQDAGGRTVIDWQPWQPSVRLPAVNGDHLVVVYRDGAQQVTARVSLRPADALLPQYAADWGSGVVVAGPNNTPVPPTPIALATNTVQAAGIVFATNTPPGIALLPTATPRPPAQPTPLPQPTAALVAAVSSGNSVTLAYDLTTLTVLPAQAGVNISGVILTNGTSQIRLGNVFAGGLRGTLQGLNARDCIFISVNSAVTASAASAGCGFIAKTFLTPDRAIWTGDFRAERGGVVLAQCRAADRRCVVPLG
jgi:hypothetical protein